MFNLFRRKQATLIQHQHKQLCIFLPSIWKYELEEGGQEACFDPKSKSTLRVNIIELIPPAGSTSEQDIKFMTADQPYVTTLKGYLLTSPTYEMFLESGKDITLITWRLINYMENKKLLAVLTYTVLSKERDSAREKEAFNMIEGSLQIAELSNN